MTALPYLSEEAEAFDEWLANQPDAVKKKVAGHIAGIVASVDDIGEILAKTLLWRIYRFVQIHPTLTD